jgi:hypothetical protein
MVQSAVVTGSAVRHYKDGTLIDSGTHTYATNLEKIVIGEEMANLGFIALDVSVVLLYDRALSGSERQQVEQYLQYKYVHENGMRLSTHEPDALMAHTPELPSAFTLQGNYPNPFNPTTTVTFDLPERAEVRLEIYDVLGRRVLAVPQRSFSAGANLTVEIDASSLASGMYIYRLTAAMKAGAAIRSGRFILAQ